MDVAVCSLSFIMLNGNVQTKSPSFMCALKEYGPEPGGVTKETAAFTLWALEAVRYHLVNYPKVMIVPPSLLSLGF